MPIGQSDPLQGTLQILTLKALLVGPTHGYGIARWIEHTTDDVLRIEEGSRYPALRLGVDVDRDIDDELRFHFEQLIDDYVARGLSQDASETAARERLGDLRSLEQGLKALLSTAHDRGQYRTCFSNVSKLALGDSACVGSVMTECDELASPAVQVKLDLGGDVPFGDAARRNTQHAAESDPWGAHSAASRGIASNLTRV